MKPLGFLLIAVALALGVVGAATAYSPSLALPDSRLLTTPPLTLAAPAGKSAAGGPVATAGAALDAATLRSLRSAEVRRVRVKEFAFGRWGGRWLFGAGLAGLLAGGVMVKRSDGRAGAASSQAGAAPVHELLASIERDVHSLRGAISGRDDDSARGLILDAVGPMQREAMPAFVDAARRQLTERGGLRLYASVIERFAAAERKLNRAWSAAADNAMPEARACLDEASDLLRQTRERLG
jgi:hypothetical protein